MFQFNLKGNAALHYSKVKQATTYIQQNWFQLIIVSLAAYILLHKDINFQFSMNSIVPATTEQQEHIPPSEPTELEVLPASFQLGAAPASLKKSKGKTAAINLFDLLTLKSLFGQKEKIVKNQEASFIPPSIKEIDPELLKQANSFSNLGFVLSPSYISKVDPAIVDQKMEKCKNYIRRFAPVAVAEMKKYGIPASITLAQGLLESNAGESRLTQKNRNHFGIKCFSKKCAKNHCANFTDDTHKDFFLIYSNAWESYRAHSEFLQKSRYSHLKNFGTKDYQSWAQGLKKAGYATDSKYANKLIRIIEAFELHQLDE